MSSFDDEMVRLDDCATKQGTVKNTSAKKAEKQDKPTAQTNPQAVSLPTMDVATLAQTIESEIIPRLMLLHRETRERPQAGKTLNLFETNTQKQGWAALLPVFIDILLEDNIDKAFRYTDGLVREGHLLTDVILELFSPAARSLGEMWESDALSFVDVSLGLSRLQQLIGMFRANLAPDHNPFMQPKQIFLCAVPGETHTFGIHVVEAIFIRDGWDVRRETRFSRSEILACVRSQWFDVIGLTASCHTDLSGLCDLVKVIRKQSCNGDIKITLGGSAFANDPSDALQYGSDIMACTAQDVIANVSKLIRVHHS